ncbi:MAG: Verru_Chthon cassette protein B [Chthoniobacteraceae bacterium]
MYIAMQIAPSSEVHHGFPPPAIKRYGRPKRRSVCAFSLVEVAFAIGVVAFAFIPILGLIPAGMSAFRQANSTSVTAQIAQRVANDAQQTDYDTLIQSGSATASTNGTLLLRHFDDQGNEVGLNGTALTPAQLAQSLYDVNTVIVSPTSLPATGGQQRPVSQNLATVIIQVVENPGHVANPFPPAGQVPCSVFSVLVARNQTTED